MQFYQLSPASFTYRLVLLALAMVVSSSFSAVGEEPSVKGNSASRKKRPMDMRELAKLKQLIKSTIGKREVGETEVEEVTSELELEDIPSKPWGRILLHGQFETTEVSNCWTDTTFVAAELEIREGGGMLFGSLSQHSDAANNAPLFHLTGPRCGTSDQGPVVTERESIEIRALGYYDKVDQGYYFMLEPDDVSHWTLVSGGDVGVASWMKFYLPHMYSSTVDTGGFAGFFLSDDQFSQKTTLFFSGTVEGTGAKTRGSIAVRLTKDTGTKSDLTEMLDAADYDRVQKWLSNEQK